MKFGYIISALAAVATAAPRISVGQAKAIALAIRQGEVCPVCPGQGQSSCIGC